MTHYEKVKETIAGKAQLCVVSKYRSHEQIMHYYNLGQRIFAENHAQELLQKIDLPQDIQWHFIGHLQKNKVRMVLPYLSCIQSLDSIELAKVLEKECIRLNRTIDVYAEFHLADEDRNKTGLHAEDADRFFEACLLYPHIHLCGIMVMGPHTEDTDRIKAVFDEAHDLYLHLQKKYGIEVLSMGMSADYPLAIECGSNMVRIGTYLFEGE